MLRKQSRQNLGPSSTGSSPPPNDAVLTASYKGSWTSKGSWLRPPRYRPYFACVLDRGDGCPCTDVPDLDGFISRSNKHVGDYQNSKKMDRPQSTLTPKAQAVRQAKYQHLEPTTSGQQKKLQPRLVQSERHVTRGAYLLKHSITA